MATPPPPAPEEARPARDEQEELWNLIVLQNEAVKFRLAEFHQQVECCIQQTGEHPLTGDTNVRAAHESLPLRDRTMPAHVSPLPLVSDTMASLVKELCAGSGAVRDAAAMAQLTKRIAEVSLEVEDKAQVLFLLDESFRSAGAAMLPAFEKDGGYGVLMGWFDQSCSISDESNKALSKLLLQFLGRHKPALPFSRKTVLNKLRIAQGVAIGRYNKTTIKEMVEKYRTDQ